MKPVGFIVQQQDSDLMQVIQNLTIKDVIYTLVSAWNERFPGT